MGRFRQLLPYIRPYKWRLLLSIFAAGLYTMLNVVRPLIWKYFVDDVVVPKNTDMLIPAAAALVVVPISFVGMRFLSMLNLTLVGRRFLADMRTHLYDKVLHLSMRYHGTSASGAVVGRIMSDVNMLQRLLTGNVIEVLADIVTFGFSISVAFSLAWKQALMLLGVLVLYLFVYRRYSKRIRQSTRMYRHIYDEIGGRLQETVAGVRQVRIYNMEERENELFLDRTAESLERVSMTRISGLSMNTACMTIAGLGSTMIVAMNAYFVVTGRMTIGALMAFDAYVWMAIQPAVRLTTMAGQLTETFVSVDRICEVLDEPIDVGTDSDAPKMKRGSGKVEFKDVRFRYEESTPLYEGLSLEVEAGSTVALVGHTGCGKTTLTSLLMRYWNTQGGEILVDGTDIRTVDLRSLRRLFGVVLQDPVIFDGTLAENISYGMPGATREQIEDAARAAEIYDMGVALADGFDTLLGTHGVKLSVGEKQRVSIARAILRDPAILIMDEATSSLDSESEALIQKSLSRVLKNRTSFVIAHRLSTITSADTIVVMDAGRIIERGTHSELMSREDSHYRKLYEEMLRGGDGETDPDAPEVAGSKGGAS